MEKTFTIEQKLVHALGQYLVQRPYQEVAHLVAALGGLSEIEIEPVDKPKNDKAD